MYIENIKRIKIRKLTIFVAPRQPGKYYGTTAVYCNNLDYGKVILDDIGYYTYIVKFRYYIIR